MRDLKVRKALDPVLHDPGAGIIVSLPEHWLEVSTDRDPEARGKRARRGYMLIYMLIHDISQYIIEIGEGNTKREHDNSSKNKAHACY